jgi:hypothetical protein
MTGRFFEKAFRSVEGLRSAFRGRRSVDDGMETGARPSRRGLRAYKPSATIDTNGALGRYARDAAQAPEATEKRGEFDL